MVSCQTRSTPCLQAWALVFIRPHLFPRPHLMRFWLASATDRMLSVSFRGSTGGITLAPSLQLNSEEASWEHTRDQTFDVTQSKLHFKLWRTWTILTWLRVIRYQILINVYFGKVDCRAFRLCLFTQKTFVFFFIWGRRKRKPWVVLSVCWAILRRSLFWLLLE